MSDAAEPEMDDESLIRYCERCGSDRNPCRCVDPSVPIPGSYEDLATRPPDDRH